MPIAFDVPAPNPLCVTAKDIQRELQVSRATAYAVLWQLPTLRVGKRRLALREDLIAWLRDQREARP